MLLSYKIRQHRDNNNQNVKMHVIVTLIGNPLFFNSDTMSNTLLYKMSDFHRQLFQNIKQGTTIALTSKLNMDHHYSFELLSVLEPLASIGLFG